eukprot:SAG11_NODE_3613_length_2338_cov_2.821795_2_plen_106_part_00
MDDRPIGLLDRWFTLFRSGKLGLLEPRGDVHLHLEYTPVKSGGKASKRPIRPASRSQQVGVLRITKLVGENLPAMDFGGSSDPYCHFRVVGPSGEQQQEHRTAVV